MSAFDCNSNAPKVNATMSQSQPKGKSFNMSQISFERTATGSASSTTNTSADNTTSTSKRISPPENLAKNRCDWCHSSNPITVVLAHSDHPSLDRASFCSSVCFKKFSESLNTKSIQFQSKSFPKLHPHCTHCKSIVACQQVFDSTGGLLGSFCSAECLQKYKLKLVKLKNTDQQQRLFTTKVVTPPVIESLAGPSRVNISTPKLTEQQKSQSRESSIKSQSVNRSPVPPPLDQSKPPPLISLHQNTNTINIPILSVDSSEESNDSQVLSASSNGINYNLTRHSKIHIQQIQQNKPKEQKQQNRTLPHSFKMSDCEGSKSFSNVQQQFRASTSSASLESSSKLSTSNTSLASTSSSTNVNSNSNNNNSHKAKQPPTYHYETFSVFDWDSYLKETKGKPAPANCFKQNIHYPTNEFQIGMKLEAKDPRNPSSTCIATVVALYGLRIQLRLDGSDNANDFFELVDSENIHQIGHCEKSGDMLQPPLGFRRNPSQWHAFLFNALKDAIIAPESCFKKPPATPKSNHFEVGMKLEAIDKKNPRLICPATIGKVEGERVFITFDGWKGAIDYWCNYDSRELFPVGWCEATGHPLQPPGHKVPTEHTKAKMMSMTSHTAMSLAVQNNKSVKSCKVNSQSSTDGSESKNRTLTLAASSANSTNGLNKSNGDVGGNNCKTTDPASSSPSSTKKAPVKIKINIPISNSTPGSGPTSSFTSSSSCNVPHPAATSKLTPSATLKPSFNSIVESSSNGKGDTSNNPNVSSHVNASASSSSSSSSFSSKRYSATKRSHHDANLLEQHSPLAHSHVESSKVIKVEREALCNTSPNEQGSSQCQVASPTKGKVIQPSSLNNSHSSTRKSLDSPSPSSSLPLSSPENWSVDQVIEYLLSIDPSLSIHADIFKSHEIDGRALLLLTSDMMMKFMNLKLGPALKICSIIGRLQQQNKRNPPNH